MDQMLLAVAGEGGTGKTRAIKAVELSFELLRAAATGSFASTQIYNCTGKKQIQSYFAIRNIPQLPIFLSFTDIILLSPQRHNSFHLAMTTSSPRDETRPSGRLTTLPESNISNAH